MTPTHIISFAIGFTVGSACYYLITRHKIKELNSTIRSLRKSWERLYKRHADLKQKLNNNQNSES